MSHFKPADFLRKGAGEGAALVAEQFAFQKPGGDCGANERYKRQTSARTQAVDGARDEFLPRTRFAENENRGGGGGDNFHLLVYAEKCGA